MPVYDYQAINKRGETLKGSLVANDPQHLKEMLEQRDLFFLTAAEHTAVANFFERFMGSQSKTLLFTIYMSTGVPAGLPLLEVLDNMIAETEPGHFKKVLQDIKINVEAGNRLSDALGMYPNYFNDIYRIIIETGEESGQLDVIFAYLVRLMEWEKSLKKQIKGTITPIAGILVMLTGLFFLVMLFILPNFIELFESAGVELPLPTRILINTSQFLSVNWPFLIAGGLGTYVLFKGLRFTETGKYHMDRLKLAIPITGHLTKKIAASRFANFWRILFSSGVDFGRSLELLSEVVQNKKIEEAILTAREEIINGREMAQSFRDTKIFPGLVLSMIHLGETTGNLEVALEKVTHYYDNEIVDTIDQILGLIKPIMLIFTAGLILIVGLGIVLPMFGIIETVG